MTTPNPSASLFKRCCAAVVAAALVLQPMGAYAVTLSEVPLQSVNPVKPNIMLTIDDSASMNNEYLPDFVGEGDTSISFSPAIYCRDNFLSIFGPNGTCGLAAAGVVRQADPPIRSKDFNGQFYDPTATYLPGTTAATPPGNELPCQGTNTACNGPWTAVYSDGFAGFPAANTSATTNLVSGYPDTVWCNVPTPDAAGIATAYSSSDGSVCRFNGRAYAALTTVTPPIPAIAAGYNYPNRFSIATGSAQANCPNQSGPAGNPNFNPNCFTTAATVFGNPYYYTISKVQFCSDPDPNNTHFGGTTCRAKPDTTFKYVRYGTSATLALDPQAFTRVDITPTGFLVNGVAAANPSGRTYADEMTNFARWYAFDRTRLLAMKTAAGRGFSPLGQNVRVGFHTLAENATLFQNVNVFDPSHKTGWFTNLYAVTPPPGAQTPLPDALFRIGEYFANGNSGLPGATDPLDATTGQCQKNSHILATDGYWNVPLSLGDVGNQDNIIPNTPAPIQNWTPGDHFPSPYWEGPNNHTVNTLADIAMKYWITDLRPALADNVQDPDAPWQHVTLYGVSIGAVGTVDAAGFAAIQAGGDWPVPAPNDPTTIDDLWHASINGHGFFSNAANPQELANAIAAIVLATTGFSGTATSVGIASAQFNANNTFGYLTSSDDTFAGNVVKYALDAATGAILVDASGNPINAAIWSVQPVLDAQVAGTGWDTNRRILTMNDVSRSPVPFRLSNLSPAQQTSLTAGWTALSLTVSAQNLVNYLRGDKTNEGLALGQFRRRTHVLGDIAGSAAVVVGAPTEPYSDPGFSDFVNTQSTRTSTVYVGANDGMLHAFNDSSASNGLAGPDSAKETWAYMPAAVFNNGDPNDPSHAADPAFELGALGYTGTPLFSHKFYVNATPRVWDIDLANSNTSTPPTSGNNWRTMLVGGLGAGGRAVYALDVTTPVTAPGVGDTEASLATRNVVRWEFTDVNDLGYVYDSPTLVKTLAYGWVILVASGYNSPSGKGFLFVIDPTTGTVLKKLGLPNDNGTAANPTGLGAVRAFVASRKNPIVLQAYSGDLNGNVWRFDLSSADPAQWKTELIATLTDAGGNAQPITTGIRIEIDQNNGVDRYLFIGTGQLLSQADLSNQNSRTVTNSAYVIRDGTRDIPDPAPATPYSRIGGVLNTVDPTSTNGFTGPATGRGWYIDAPDSSWRVTDLSADVQSVVFVFSKAQTSDPCAGALTSILFARDYTSGASTLLQGGTTGSANLLASAPVPEGIAGITLVQGTTGNIGVQITTNRSRVFQIAINVPGGAPLRHRVSWRLIASRD
jgi:type IV pilus assembly protein PilY1